MAKPNQGLRDRIRGAGICTYEVAAALDISTPLLYQWLQRDLSPEKLERIEGAIVMAAERKRSEA